MKFKLIDPSEILIEKTAAEMAGVFFDAARSSGMGIIMLQNEKIDLRRFKNNPRKFAQAHLEKFIPAAVHALNEIMCRETTPEPMKRAIYDAIMERINDEQVNVMGAQAGLAEFTNTPIFKPDNEKPKPIILNTPKIDFQFDSKRVS